MDMLLGGLAFAAIIFGQFAAVIAVHDERKSRESQASARQRRESEASAPQHPDHRAGLLWDSGS